MNNVQYYVDADKIKRLDARVVELNLQRRIAIRRAQTLILQEDIRNETLS